MLVLVLALLLVLVLTLDWPLLARWFPSRSAPRYSMLLARVASRRWTWILGRTWSRGWVMTSAMCVCIPIPGRMTRRRRSRPRLHGGVQCGFSARQVRTVIDRGPHDARPRADACCAAAQRTVDGTPTGRGIQVSDPSDRFEQEAAANAERAMSAPAPAAVSPAGSMVQREAAPEEEEQPSAQGSFIQRVGGEEEEAPPA